MGKLTLFERTNPYWNMQVKPEKPDGASEISARDRLPDSIHQFLLTHTGYGDDYPGNFWYALCR